jgi:endonuclease YncB( thermonuclease family)
MINVSQFRNRHCLTARVDELSLSDRQLFLQAESTAQHKRLGLWHDRDPTPPWVWRHRTMP